MKILSKAVSLLNTSLCYLCLLVKVDLRSVRLIRDTDNIASVREKLQILGKLLFRCQVYDAACSSLKLCAEFLTRSNAYNGAVAHVVFRTYKLF